MSQFFDPTRLSFLTLRDDVWLLFSTAVFFYVLSCKFFCLANQLRFNLCSNFVPRLCRIYAT